MPLRFYDATLGVGIILLLVAIATTGHFMEQAREAHATGVGFQYALAMTCAGVSLGALSMVTVGHASSRSYYFYFAVPYGEVIDKKECDNDGPYSRYEVRLRGLNRVGRPAITWTRVDSRETYENVQIGDHVHIRDLST